MRFLILAIIVFVSCVFYNYGLFHDTREVVINLKEGRCLIGDEVYLFVADGRLYNEKTQKTEKNKYLGKKVSEIQRLEMDFGVEPAKQIRMTIRCPFGSISNNPDSFGIMVALPNFVMGLLFIVFITFFLDT
jgi:hypothetical protein